VLSVLSVLSCVERSECACCHVFVFRPLSARSREVCLTVCPNVCAGYLWLVDYFVRCFVGLVWWLYFLVRLRVCPRLCFLCVYEC